MDQSGLDSSSKSAPAPKIKSIGHYFLGKTIGEGTFGKVKLGTHSLTGEKVAVKVLEKERIGDVADVERVAREIHILKLIRHPNIIQLFEIIETPKQLYLIMEFASGGEVFDYIVSHSRVKEREACRFFQQIISGVEYISRLGVVHRDLKPENLLLNYDKSIKIVDFGLSNTYKSKELLKTACGSPCYAAPEMIAGKMYEGVKVDIWSCGVILFALVCGYLPFEDPNTSELYKKILAGEYQCPDFLSVDCVDLLSHILTTDPDTRYTIEEIHKHPWYQLVKQEIAPGLIVGYNQILMDKQVLSQLEKYGLNSEYARNCIEANKHNHVTTTYYLLLAKKIREGGVLDLTNECEVGDGQDKPLELDLTGSIHPPVPKLSLDLSLFPIIVPRRRRTASQGKRTNSIAETFSVRERSAGHRAIVSQGGGAFPGPIGLSGRLRKLGKSVSPGERVRGKRSERGSVLKEGMRGTPTPRPPVQTPPHLGMRSWRVRRQMNMGVPTENLEYGNTHLSPKTALASESLNVSQPLDDSIRKAKGAFSISCTSSRDPSDLLHDVSHCLTSAKVSYLPVPSTQGKDCSLRCHKGAIQFEVEIGVLEGATGLYAVKFKRVAGEMKAYKALCSRLLNELVL